MTFLPKKRLLSICRRHRYSFYSMVTSHTCHPERSEGSAFAFCCHPEERSDEERFSIARFSSDESLFRLRFCLCRKPLENSNPEVPTEWDNRTIDARAPHPYSGPAWKFRPQA